MKELQLSEIKKIELDILKYFDQFCSENKIRYFLCNGTLLGSVKYKGFIPWDDDIDVMMPRKDYDRFIQLHKSKENKKLLCQEKDEQYVFPFAKLMDTTTIISNQTTLKRYVYGLHIDIFPIDYWNENLKKSQKQASQIQRYLTYCGLSIACFSKGRNILRTCLKNALIFCTHLIGHKYYFKKLQQMVARVSYTQKRNCGCVVWPVYGKREVLPIDIFSNSVMLEFEGFEFPAPIGYDTYLRSLYGNYEMDPPPKKQKTHHSFKAYKL